MLLEVLEALGVQQIPRRWVPVVLLEVLEVSSWVVAEALRVRRILHRCALVARLGVHQLLGLPIAGGVAAVQLE